MSVLVPCFAHDGMHARMSIMCMSCIGDMTRCLRDNVRDSVEFAPACHFPGVRRGHTAVSKVIRSDVGRRRNKTKTANIAQLNGSGAASSSSGFLLLLLEVFRHDPCILIRTCIVTSFRERIARSFRMRQHPLVHILRQL